MHRTIVVAASEGEPLRDAFALGIALARPRGAGLVLAHVDLGEGRALTELEQLAATAPPDIPARAVSVTAPSIVAGLHRVVSTQHAELLVLGASHLTSVTRMVRGDVAMGAVRDAACGVASAPLGYAAKPPVEPRRIGVAWDASPEAAEALEWAVQLAERTGGEVRIVHVLDGDADEQEARARLEELRHRVEDRAPASVDVRRGDPAVKLAADAALDLLVLGSRGRGPVQRVVLGSVSAKVMRQQPCPVVVLPRGVQAPVETVA